MKSTLNTTLFGTIWVDSHLVVHFPDGLIGFPELTHWVPVVFGEHAYIQSTQDGSMAFLVIDAATRKDYVAEVPPELADSSLVLLIVCAGPNKTTINLKAPLVCNIETRTGVHVIQSKRGIEDCRAPF